MGFFLERKLLMSLIFAKLPQRNRIYVAGLGRIVMWEWGIWAGLYQARVASHAK